MAILSTAERNKLPSSAFVFPDSRSYPIHDENHAHAALQDAAQFGSPDEQAKVRAAVRKRYPRLSTRAKNMRPEEVQAPRSFKAPDPSALGSG